MNDTTCRWFHRLSTALALNIASCVEGAGEVRFNRDIRPILSDKCFKCHGPDANHRKADLRLDTLEGALADIGDYAAVVPGAPGKSELIARITTGDEDDVMPPPDTGKTLSDDEKKLFRDWIAQGGEYEAHWAYIPLKRPLIPTVSARAWPSGAIDRFILVRIERANLSPSPQADAATLARRLHFDLTGLPPSLRLAKRLASDTSPEAYARVVDELLASPRFGERLATYWLDLVRYADTVGYHGDQDHAITPYRDWVIKAFNDNLPFDQFTAEQLAGDLLPNATMNQKIASGYNRLLQTSHEGGVQKKEYLAKYSADRVRNVSNAWLGATMGCSECHDHKYDPFTQKDFYSLAAFFADVNDDKTFSGTNTLPTKREPELQVVSPLDVGQAKLTRTMVTGRIKPRTIRVLPRGNWMDDSGEIVEPAVPHFLPVLKNGSRANRLHLAEWLTSADNPLTARVFVNRLWYLLFGSGLSSTLDDTGSQGEWPTHPGLLDWLAVEFVESGWDVKHIVRLMVTSSAYRQSSLVSPQLREHDPENRLFMRQGRFRLQAETIRDNALAVGGLLNDQMGGKVAKPYQPAGYYSPMNFPKRKYSADKNANQYRRGVYVHWQRQFLHPMLRAFDAPTREECTAQRPVSNTPLAALTLMNDPTFVEAAKGFALRILKEAGATDQQRLGWAWQTALGREPSGKELNVARAFLGETRKRYQADAKAADKLLAVGMLKLPVGMARPETAAWTVLGQALLNLSETITRN
ncbi:MAG: PSD1 and planctomycete cytochrome C domain-containing protein [Verrucomicrobiota bacterium]|nr:PSD1 and planctomycete cytochrome C domain-containing protein [Verrucomicrobiota bacterium]